MIKDIMTANESIAPNSREMEILKEHFPACFHSDGSFDLARFQEFLSDKVAVTNDGYEIRFLGKNYARLLASVDTTTVIVPDEEHNSKPENAHSENVYISGDNLDGLKHLLKSYARKVKCIYIDPPYNTGSDGFVYNDSYNFTAEELSEMFENWSKEEYKSDIASIRVVNGAGGDGGVESYATLKDGSIIGLQAKWFPTSMASSQIAQIKNSIKTAKKSAPGD